MGIDLEKLSAAPWRAKFDADAGCWLVVNASGPVGMPELDDATGEAFVEFTALARNAFEVMMRRGWCAARWGDGAWVVRTNGGRDWVPNTLDMPNNWPDPFTALVEADRWYRENVESHHGQEAAKTQQAQTER